MGLFDFLWGGKDQQDPKDPTTPTPPPNLPTFANPNFNMQQQMTPSGMGITPGSVHAYNALQNFGQMDMLPPQQVAPLYQGQGAQKVATSPGGGLPATAPLPPPRPPSTASFSGPGAAYDPMATGSIPKPQGSSANGDPGAGQGLLGFLKGLGGGTPQTLTAQPGETAIPKDQYASVGADPNAKAVFSAPSSIVSNGSPVAWFLSALHGGI